MNSEVDLTKQCYQIWQKVAKVAKKCYQKSGLDYKSKLLTSVKLNKDFDCM